MCYKVVRAVCVHCYTILDWYILYQFPTNNSHPIFATKVYLHLRQAEYRSFLKPFLTFRFVLQTCVWKSRYFVQYIERREAAQTARRSNQSRTRWSGITRRDTPHHQSNWSYQGYCSTGCGRSIYTKKHILCNANMLTAE